MDMGDTKNRPVGFFDTGVGGISVLKRAMEIMPKENYIYFGDSKNAPYGTRPVEEVKTLTYDAIEFLLEKGAKAIVVACNTATSVAIESLRKKYKSIPIIGVEPALKPAVEMRHEGKIIIMATPITLVEKKFNNLVINYGKNSEIEPLPCAGLVELIESGITEGEELNHFLTEKLEKYLNSKIAAIVLGCTHYPFINRELQKVVGENVPIIDGSEGTAKELKRKLVEHNLLNEENGEGTVEIYNSLDRKEIVDFSYKLLYGKK